MDSKVLNDDELINVVGGNSFSINDSDSCFTKGDWVICLVMTCDPMLEMACEVLEICGNNLKVQIYTYNSRDKRKDKGLTEIVSTSVCTKIKKPAWA